MSEPARQELFRREALEHHSGARGEEGSLLELAPVWSRRTYWLLIAALVESTLLWSAAFVATHNEVTAPASFGLYAIIALTALAMGLRNATVRQLKIPDITTTVLTLTLAGLAADSTLGGGANVNWGRRIASVAAIFVGAVAGAFLVLSWGLAPPLLLAGALILASTLLCYVRLPS